MLNKVHGKFGKASGQYPVAKRNVTVNEMKASEQEVFKAVLKKFVPEEVLQLAGVNLGDEATAKSVN